MEKNAKDLNFSDAIFGTSSDDITRGLHNGEFPDDKNQIVNEQEQNEIVNPSEEDFEQVTPLEPQEKDANISLEKKEEIPQVAENEPEQETDPGPIVSGEK